MTMMAARIPQDIASCFLIYSITCYFYSVYIKNSKFYFHIIINHKACLKNRSPILRISILRYYYICWTQISFYKCQHLTWEEIFFRNFHTCPAPKPSKIAFASLQVTVSKHSYYSWDSPSCWYSLKSTFYPVSATTLICLSFYLFLKLSG